MNSLQYHNREYSIPQFVEEFSNKLPVMVEITSGSSGCGYEISADEVYLIHRFQRQKRLVVKETSSSPAATGRRSRGDVKFLSIPYEYPARFQIIEDKINKKLGSPMPLERLMETARSRPAPHLICFENNATVSFTIGGQKNMMATFGVMEVVDTYHQKYLAGHPIAENCIYSETSAIPTFMDITLTVAMGVKGRSQATFRNWIKDIEDTITGFGTKEAPMYPEIVEFNEVPDSGHYEYMQLNNFFILQNQRKGNGYTALIPSSGGGSGSSSTYYNTSPGPSLPPRSITPQIPSRTAPGGSKRDQRRRLPPLRPDSPVPFRKFGQLSEVPGDLCISSLTMEDVAHCLCLLGMWKHAVTMQERSVDGAILMALDKTTLVKDFSFTEFDATQLINFRSGWRPNT